ncbi:MAG: DUF4115 domain-containing protein [Azospirillaceae bacterium]
MTDDHATMAQTKRKFFSVITEDGPIIGAANQHQRPLTVAEELRQAREDTGLSLRELSEVLRIRYVYLSAIENGRWEDLPGPVYAIGFIRTVSLYVGLDADEMVRRFKGEVDGVDRRADLNFPVPAPESRMPGGIMVLLALILAGAAYGGWYVFSAERSEQMAVIDDNSLPDRFAAILQEDGPLIRPASIADRRSAGAVMTPEEPGQPVGALGVPLSSSGSNSAPGSVPASDAAPDATATPGSDPSAAPLPAIASGSTGIWPVRDASAVVPGGYPIIPGPTADRQPAGYVPSLGPAPGSAAVEGDAAGDAANALRPPEADAVAPASAEAGVEIRATGDSWVLVRDANDNMIMTGVMRDGEVYQVPDQPGLSLWTGNAGGLDIYVDGELAPSLGGQGEVLQRVSLDGERLTSGTAVGN